MPGRNRSPVEATWGGRQSHLTLGKEIEMNRVSSLVAGLLLVASAAYAQTSTAPANDSQISDHVAAALNRTDPNLVVHLEVTAKDGIVTLSGQTRSPQDAIKAIQTARSVAGVTQVRNRLSSVR
jgi:osmotically-inducible protein OsmY